MGSHSLFQGIFPIQALNPGLPHCRRILYGLSHQGSPLFDAIYKHWERMRRKTSCWRFSEWQNQQAHPVLSPKFSMMKESLERPTWAPKGRKWGYKAWCLQSGLESSEDRRPTGVAGIVGLCPQEERGAPLTLACSPQPLDDSKCIPKACTWLCLFLKELVLTRKTTEPNWYHLNWSLYQIWT